MKFNYKENKLRERVKWLISYWIVLMIIISICLVSIFGVRNFWYEKSCEYSEQIIQTEKKRLDEKIQIAVNTALKLSLNKAVIDYAKEEMSFDDKIYNAIQVRNVIKNYFTLAENVNDAYIAFLKNDYIVGNNGNNSTEDFLRVQFGNKKNEFLDILHKKQANAIIYDNKLLYIHSVYEKNEVIANIVIQIGLENTSEEYYTQLYVYDGMKNIASVSNHKVNKDLEEITKNYDENEPFKKYGTDIVRVLNSYSGDLKYVMIVSESVYLKDFSSIKFLLTLSVLLAVIISVFLPVFLVRLLYRPIEEVLNNMKKYTNEPLSDKSEMDMIKNVFEKLVTEKTHYEEEIANIKEVDYLKFALKENVEIKEEKIPSVKRKLHKENGVYLMWVCYLENVQEAFFDDMSDVENNFSQISYAIKNMTNDIFADTNTLLALDMSNIQTAFLMSYKDKNYDEIINRLEYLEEFIKEYINVDVFIAVSSQHIKLSDFGKGYNECRACYQKKIFDSRKVISYTYINSSEMDEMGNGVYYFPISSKKRIEECIRNGNSDLAIAEIDRILEKNFMHHTKNAVMLKCFTAELVGLVANLIGEIDFEELNELVLENELFKIMEKSDISLIYKDIVSFLKTVCDFIKRNKTNVKKEIICEKVKKYLEDNYSNALLSLVSVADEFNISSSYLSTMYKERYGIGLTEYLREYRLNAAEKMLKENKYTIDEIAERVGYANARSFTRVFTQLYGVSPGKYGKLK